MQLEKAAKMWFVQKICTFNVDEIDTLLLLLLLFVHEIAVESSIHFSSYLVEEAPISIS
jgi:hypothetical protein